MPSYRLHRMFNIGKEDLRSTPFGICAMKVDWLTALRHISTERLLNKIWYVRWRAYAICIMSPCQRDSGMWSARIIHVSKQHASCVYTDKNIITGTAYSVLMASVSVAINMKLQPLATITKWINWLRIWRRCLCSEFHPPGWSWFGNPISGSDSRLFWHIRVLWYMCISLVLVTRTTQTHEPIFTKDAVWRKEVSALYSKRVFFEIFTTWGHFTQNYQYVTAKKKRSNYLKTVEGIGKLCKWSE